MNCGRTCFSSSFSSLNPRVPLTKGFSGQRPQAFAAVRACKSYPKPGSQTRNSCILVFVVKY